MPTFGFEAVADSGRRLKGIEDAESVEALRLSLAARGSLLVVSHALDRMDAPRSRRGRRTDMAGALASLAVMLEAGSPLERALSVAERSAQNHSTRVAIAELRERVRGGSSLADAMLEIGDPFSLYAAGMVRAGERSGRLVVALQDLTASLERSRSLRSELLGAMTYPIVVASVGAVSVTLLFLLVLPSFGDLLADAQVPLPATTGFLLGFGAFLTAQWPVLLLGAGILLTAAYGCYRDPRGRLRIHRALFTLPLIGPLRMRYAASQVGRGLSSLLGQGVPALRALTICEQIVTDEAVRVRLRAASQEVTAGGRLALALGGCGCFPPTFLHLVEVGEEGGRLPELLARASTLSETELYDQLRTLVRLAEPAMIVLFGILVGFVALALLQAVYGIQAGGF